MYRKPHVPRWIPVDDQIRFNSNGSRGIYYMCKFWAVREVYTWYLMFFLIAGIATRWDVPTITYFLHLLFLVPMLFYRLQANRLLRMEYRIKETARYV